MWDSLLRWSWGKRPTPTDEEEEGGMVVDRPTSTTYECRDTDTDGANKRMAATTDGDAGAASGTLTRPLRHEQSVRLTKSPPHSAATSHILIQSPSNNADNANMSKPISHDEHDEHVAMHQGVLPQPDQKDASQGPSIEVDHGSIEEFLLPVIGLLSKLKRTTPSRMPPYTPHMKTKSHMQVVKERLLPIGQFIVEKTRDLPNGRELELNICRFIAAHHWPLPTHDTTHLRIFEMYHNAIYKKTLSAPSPRSTPFPEGLDHTDTEQSYQGGAYRRYLAKIGKQLRQHDGSESLEEEDISR